MTNFFNTIKDIQKLKDQFADIKNSFSEVEETGISGGGLVKVRLSGNLTLLSVKIDPSLVETKDVKMIEDLIVSAHANGTEKIQEAMREKIIPFSEHLKDF